MAIPAPVLPAIRRELPHADQPGAVGQCVTRVRPALSGNLHSGLLQPVLEDWHDKTWPVSLVRTRGRVASDDIAAFSAFVAGLFPLATVPDVPYVPYSRLQQAT